jgi:hypothetical protein
VRISPDFVCHAPEDVPDDMQANYISYLLARIINIAFADDAEGFSLEDRVLEWQSLDADVKIWKENLPASFDPYSTANVVGNAFPSLWMLHPWHGKSPGQITLSPMCSN